MERAMVVGMLIVLAGLGANSCTTIGSRVKKPVAEQEVALAVEPGDILDGAHSRKISFVQLIERLAQADVVYIGETHVSQEDHEIQWKILKALYTRNSNLVVAMEMFASNTDPVLKKWSAGTLEEKAFLTKVRWQETWGYPFSLYRKVLEWVRDHRIPLYGLNIPVNIVRKIARKGLAGLTAKERSMVAAGIDRSDKRYKTYVEEQYRSHPKITASNFDHFYDAQLAWDESMAEHLANILRRVQRRTQIIVLVGKGHVQYRFGIPERTLRRVRHKYAIVLPTPFNAVLAEMREDAGDYFWATRINVSRYSHKARLGVMLRPLKDEPGLEIVKVLKDSPAARAGLRAGDRIVDVDGMPVTTLQEMMEAFRRGRELHEFTIRRKKCLMKLRIKVPRGENGSARKSQ